MFENRFLARLAAGEALLGFCNMYPAAGIIEGMAQGWDFCWIDGQHGEMSYDSLMHAIRTAQLMKLETLVRVPSHESGVLCAAADLAPSAVMVPMVNTAGEASRVVDGLRFPPLGKRSYGGRRVIDLYGREYYREQPLGVVAQIETLDAVANADAIAATDGVDVLFFGPDDMKVRMGLPINTKIDESQELQDAMRTVVEACSKAGKYAGCVAATPEALRMARELGYQLIVGGGDIAILRVAAAERIQTLRSVLEGDEVRGKHVGDGVY